MKKKIEFVLNGKAVQVETDDYRTLLDVIREEFVLLGTKYGCGEGECGACTVLIDGDVTRACVTSIGDAAGTEVTTIEGIGREGNLHLVQQAFIDNLAMQCGYCVPGQIMAAVGLLNENATVSREEIIEGMDGNICRCCNYANILAAVESVAQGNTENKK
jgi:aerobic-type carbon monoxide dehydrogenase small subunit (CoxS/CutS family)